MANGDYGTQFLFGVPLGYLEGATPAIRFPLFIDYASASNLKARTLDGGTLFLAPSTGAPTRDALVTISLANAAGRQWRVLNLDGVKLTQARLDSDAWALIIVDAADALAANYRTTTVDGGNITTVFTGTGDYRALLTDSSADVSATPFVRNVFGGRVAFNPVTGGSALLGGGGASAPAVPNFTASFIKRAWLPHLGGMFQNSNGTTPVVSNGNAVGYIPDQSTAADPLLQATAANKGVYRPTGVNGQPGVEIVTDDFFALTSLALTNFTIIAVYDVSAHVGAAGYLLAGSSQGVLVGGDAVAGYGEFDGTNLRAANEKPTTPEVFVFQNAKLFRNGVEAAYANTSTLTGLTLTRLGVRPDNPTNPGLRFDGVFGGIIIADIIMDAAQLLTYGGYLASVYGRTWG